MANSSLTIIEIPVTDNVEHDITILQQKNDELHKMNSFLKAKVEDLEIRLKKYTNGDNHKRYYEKNKNKIKESGTQYLKKLKSENPDKLKEYSHNAYERKKLKKKIEEEENMLIECSEPIIT